MTRHHWSTDTDGRGLRTVALAIAATALVGCAGSRNEVSFRTARYPVSMTERVLGPNGEVLGPPDWEEVGRLRARESGWSILWSLVSLGDVDLSDDVNGQVLAAGGEAVVGLSVSSTNASFPNWGAAAFLHLLPIWPGKVDVGATGTIVRRRGGVAQSR